MKIQGSKLYLLLLFVFLVLVFLYQYYSPKEFIWKPTFSKHDKQPFGSYVFDDVMSSSVTDYKVVNKTFYQLYLEYSGLQEQEVEMFEEDEEGLSDYDEHEYLLDEEESESYENEEPQVVLPLPFGQRHAILLTENHLNFTSVDVNALFNLLKQGNKVMLCLSSFSGELCDSLCFTGEYDQSYFYKSMERYVKEGNQRDSLFFGPNPNYPEQIYAVYPHLHPIYLKEGCPDYQNSDSMSRQDRIRCESSEILVRNKEGEPVAMRLRMGEGELFLVATPLLFTNYGMLDGDNASYVFRLLSYMKELPLVRIESYGINNQPSGTPLRYILSQPPLQWALYVTLSTILLFMIFTAKRRQRIIPVVHPPVNQTLRFTQLIGNLYYQKKDYKDILKKKYLYFCTEVKLLNGLDLQSEEPDEALCSRLSDKMGKDFKEIWPVFRELKYLLQEDSLVDETSMMRLIDQMNEWNSYLYN